MIVATDSFCIKTSLSEDQVEALLKEKIAIRTLSFRFQNCEGFAGQLYSERKEFEFAYFYRKAKCAIVKGSYMVDGENTTTIHFDIRWPLAEVLLFVVCVLSTIMVPFLYSAQFVALPKQFLVGWMLIPLAFCVGALGYFYIPSIKRAKAKLLEMLEPNVHSVIED